MWHLAQWFPLCVLGFNFYWEKYLKIVTWHFIVLNFPDCFFSDSMVVSTLPSSYILSWDKEFLVKRLPDGLILHLIGLICLTTERLTILLIYTDVRHGHRFSLIFGLLFVFIYSTIIAINLLLLAGGLVRRPEKIRDYISGQPMGDWGWGYRREV